MGTKHEFLAELRRLWRGIIFDAGGHCPCCDRWGKVYGRTLNKTMARSLVWLAHHSANGEWVDVPKTAPRWLLRSNQLATLRWWDLIERHGTDDPTKKHSGFWRATPKGQDFANNRIEVPKKVFTYDADVVDFSDEEVRIKDCIEIFDYRSVMESAA